MSLNSDEGYSAENGDLDLLPIPPEDPAVVIYENIIPLLDRMVEGSTKSIGHTLMLFETRPTLLITTELGTGAWIPREEEDFIRSLTSLNFEVFESRRYRHTLSLCDGVSSSAYQTGTSTIGGYMKDQFGKVFALTNHHAVTKSLNPITNQNSKGVVAYSPAHSVVAAEVRKRSHRKGVLERKIVELSRKAKTETEFKTLERYRATYEQIKTGWESLEGFLAESKNRLGMVCHSSGIRTRVRRSDTRTQLLSTDQFFNSSYSPNASGNSSETERSMSRSSLSYSSSSSSSTPSNGTQSSFSSPASRTQSRSVESMQQQLEMALGRLALGRDKTPANYPLLHSDILGTQNLSLQPLAKVMELALESGATGIELRRVEEEWCVHAELCTFAEAAEKSMRKISSLTPIEVQEKIHQFLCRTKDATNSQSREVYEKLTGHHLDWSWELPRSMDGNYQLAPFRANDDTANHPSSESQEALSSKDWAIIMVDEERLGDVSNEWKQAGISGDFDAGPLGIATSPPIAYTRVSKNGRRTGYTQGRINGTTKTTKMPGMGKTLTREWCVMGDEKRFSDKGDSGAFIIDDDAVLIGLVFGGEELLKEGRTRHLSYFQPINEILQDIQEETGLILSLL